MRPNLADLLDGINRTVMSVSMPIVQRSGDMQSLWEVAAATRIMSYVQKRWKTEFARLARDNARMAELVTAAAAALRDAGSDRADELTVPAARPAGSMENLPSIDELEADNLELKQGLERFIIIHSEMKNPDQPALWSARQEIRKFLRETTARDFAAAQEVIFF